MRITLSTLGARLRNARLNAGYTQEGAAEAVGIPRTALVQIEAGSRSVSILEVLALARLYRRDLRLLLAEEGVEDEDPLVALCRVQAELAEDSVVRKEITRCFNICREGVDLQKLLDDTPLAVAPAYELSEPRNLFQAIEQGEGMAAQERKRLNLGSGCIGNVAEIISSQGIWAAAARLLPDLSGLFLHQPSTIGMVILVNDTHARGRQRFSYSHEYGHALADRTRDPASVTSKGNANALTEKRANAFAGELLLPAEGIWDALGRLRKGGGSREMKGIWDVATGSGDYVEKRNVPGSQKIGYQDVALLAHEYIVSYDTVVYRLSDMGAISRSEVAGLLQMKDDGREFIQVLRLLDPDEQEDEQAPLERQIGRLAVEAFRRDLINGDRLLYVCQKLGIDGKRLLGLVQAAQQ